MKNCKYLRREQNKMTPQDKHESVVTIPETPKSSRTAVFAILSSILFLCGLLPFCLYAIVKLDRAQQVSYTSLTYSITGLGFLTVIGVGIMLTWLASKYMNKDAGGKIPASVWGVYSALFGIVITIFLGLFDFYSRPPLNLGASEMAAMVLFPSIIGFPLLGFAFGVIGITSKWGKVGISINLVYVLIWIYMLFFQVSK